MKGKSYSIPIGMVFKKYYCHKCGTKLTKERTHRIVSKDDKDYYQYNDYNTFPRYDVDVYNYRFKCPTCENRITYNDQCVIEKIQKKCQSKILTDIEIKDNLKEYQLVNSKRKIISNICQ